MKSKRATGVFRDGYGPPDDGWLNFSGTGGTAEHPIGRLPTDQIHVLSNNIAYTTFHGLLGITFDRCATIKNSTGNQVAYFLSKKKANFSK